MALASTDSSSCAHYGNGRKTPRGCSCNAGWTGSSCDILNLLPAAAAAGYRNSSTPTWGGTIIESGGVWHLFSAGKMTNGTSPRVVRAVSDAGPAGPYSWAQDVISAVQQPSRLGAHGLGLRTDVHVAPNGSLVLYTTGSLDGRYGLLALTSRDGNPAGPWALSLPYHHVENASATWSCGFDDPSASIDAATGDLLVVYRTAWGCAGQPAEHLALLHAPLWDGDDILTPLTTESTGPLFTFSDSNEDPYLWRSDVGVHMLTHTQGGARGQWPDRKTRGAVAFSPGDGTNLSAWRLSASEAWNATVAWTNGTSSTALRRQRPSLVFSRSSRAPTHLITGVNFASADFHETDADWTLIQPLNL